MGLVSLGCCAVRVLGLFSNQEVRHSRERRPKRSVLHSSSHARVLRDERAQQSKERHRAPAAVLVFRHAPLLYGSVVLAVLL